MENFTYQAGTKVLFGKDQINHLASIINEYGQKVLICYGSTAIKNNGLLAKVHHLLRNFEIFELSDISPNPKVESVRKGVKLCRENKIDVVLAIGGGSVLDCAKAICAAVYYQKDAWEMIKTMATPNKALPLITVLTHAATGSEYNCGAVISNLATNEKLGYECELVQPKVSILDPTYTFTVSKKQIAAGCADIFAHLIEQYFTKDIDYLAKQLCTAALKTLIHYTPIAYNENDNYEARANLMWLSSLACNGIISLGSSFSGWANHALEHELSAFYDIIHGEGLAILIPRWMEYIVNKETIKDFKDYGIDVWGINPDLNDEEIAKQAIEKTFNFFKSLNMPMYLKELNITDEYFEQMAKHATEVNYLDYAYVPLKEEDIKNILIMCL